MRKPIQHTATDQTETMVHLHTIQNEATARHELLLRELGANQALLLAVAADLSHVDRASLTLICCDLRVLIGHPEVGHTDELVAKLNAIADRVSGLDSRLCEIAVSIRQHESVALRTS